MKVSIWDSPTHILTFFSFLYTNLGLYQLYHDIMNGVNYLVESCVESFITDLYSDPEVVALEEFYIKTAKRIGAKKCLLNLYRLLKN